MTLHRTLHPAICFFLTAILMVSCMIAVPEVAKPVYPEVDETDAESGDDESPTPGSSIGLDYSLLEASGHPRLIYSAADFERIADLVKSDAVASRIHNTIIGQCDQFINKPALSYKITGNRLLSVSREAIKRIVYLSYAYRITGNYNYLIKIEAEINSVCSFKDWHDSHYLDAAEMATAVAIGLDWSYEYLKPKTREKARLALEKFLFTQAEGNSFLTMTNNWNAVCNGSLVLASLACYEKNKSRSIEMLEMAVNSNKEYGFKGYGVSGSYMEGYMYWGYGTTYETIIIAALEKIFGSNAGLFEPGSAFAESAYYILNMAGTTGKCFNYSDCDEDEQPKLPMWWFASRLNDATLLYNEMRLLDEGLYDDDFEESRFLPLMFAFMNPDFTSAQIPAPTQKVWSAPNGDSELGVPVVLIHTDWTLSETDKFFGIKGGRPNISHAHMDGTTFVYDAYGVRWAMDLGRQDYGELENAIGASGVSNGLWDVGQNSRRWTVLRLNNHGHNVMTVNGNDYHYKGKAFLQELDEENLSSRWDCCGINRYPSDYDLVAHPSRRAQLLERDGDYDLVITDEFTTCNGKTPLIRWQFATPADAVVFAPQQTVRLEKDGKTLFVVFKELASGHKLDVQSWEARGGHYYDDLNPGVSFVGFETKFTKAGEEKAKIQVTFTNVKPDGLPDEPEKPEDPDDPTRPVTDTSNGASENYNSGDEFIFE